MKRADRTPLENALRAHYRNERALATPLEEHADEVAKMAASAASGPPAHRNGFAEIAKAAVGSAPRVFWAAPAAVIALALGLALSSAPAYEAEAALSASGSILAAAGLAGIVRARSCGMQELEASCLHNAVAIACARIAAFGTTSLLALALACIACSTVMPTGTAVAYALAPYLLSAAGGFMLARRVASGDSAAAAVIWSASICALCVLLRVAIPEAYCDAAIWAWAAASAAGALWCIRETARWLRFSTQGGCVPAKAARPAIL